MGPRKEKEQQSRWQAVYWKLTEWKGEPARKEEGGDASTRNKWKKTVLE